MRVFNHLFFINCKALAINTGIFFKIVSNFLGFCQQLTAKIFHLTPIIHFGSFCWLLNLLQNTKRKDCKFSRRLKAFNQG